MGVWDFEGIYTRFKTLGAKRYITEHDNEIEITVAGVGKKEGSDFISTFDNPFDSFTYDLTFKGENTGKLTHTYIDKEIQGYMKDYEGVLEYFISKTGIHLQPCDYFMSISPKFSEYLDSFIED